MDDGDSTAAAVAVARVVGAPARAPTAAPLPCSPFFALGLSHLRSFTRVSQRFTARPLSLSREGPPAPLHTHRARAETHKELAKGSSSCCPFPAPHAPHAPSSSSRGATPRLQELPPTHTPLEWLLSPSRLRAESLPLLSLAGRPPPAPALRSRRSSRPLRWRGSWRSRTGSRTTRPTRLPRCVTSGALCAPCFRATRDGAKGCSPHPTSSLCSSTARGGHAHPLPLLTNPHHHHQPQRKPWAEVFDRSSFSKPATIQEVSPSCTRRAARAPRAVALSQPASRTPSTHPTPHQHQPPS